ncbi:MAG TPA: class I SAM-dependent methyltransferase [Nocardioidaceae bacterium]
MSSFDEKAATWDDDPAKVERARVVADAIRKAVPVSSDTRVLDVGAGTGLLSQQLAGDVGPITLVDPSTGMREVMAEKVASGRLPEGSRIWDLDLATAPTPADRFDLVVTLMTMHHVDDVPRVLSAFVEMLDIGGHVAIVDLVSEDGSFHGEGFEGHRGFDPHRLAAQLRERGLTDVEVREDIHGVDRNGTRYPVFLVTGAKTG